MLLALLQHQHTESLSSLHECHIHPTVQCSTLSHHTFVNMQKLLVRLHPSPPLPSPPLPSPPLPSPPLLPELDCRSTYSTDAALSQPFMNMSLTNIMCAEVTLRQRLSMMPLPVQSSAAHPWPLLDSQKSKLLSSMGMWTFSPPASSKLHCISK